MLFSAVLAAEYNRVIIFKGPIADKVLRGHVIRREKVANEGGCRVKCFLEPNCVSINVGPAVAGNRSCELNNDTDESQSLLWKKNNFIHYSVEVKPFTIIVTVSKLDIYYLNILTHRKFGYRRIIKPTTHLAWMIADHTAGYRPTPNLQFFDSLMHWFIFNKGRTIRKIMGGGGEGNFRAGGIFFVIIFLVWIFFRPWQEYLLGLIGVHEFFFI